MGKTVAQQMKFVGEQFPEREIFVFYDENLKKSSITFKDLYVQSAKFAHLLKSKGVKKGDSVVLSVPTSIELAVAFYGGMHLGAKVIHADAGKLDVFYHCINKCKAKLLIVRSDDCDPTWAHIKSHVTGIKKGEFLAELSDPKAPSLQQVFMVNREDKNNNIRGFLETVQAYSGSLEDPGVTDTDTCGLWLTSGSTGMPKLVVRSHKSLVVDSIQENGLCPMQRFFSNTPWGWIVSSPFDCICGSTRVQPELWNKSADIYKWFADIFRLEGVKCAFLTPPELQGTLKYWDLSEKKLVDTIVVGGYSISYKMCEWFLSCVNNVFIRYGCSELLSIGKNNISDLSQYKDFDCGKLCSGTTMKTVDDDMKEVPKGTPGRLMLKSEGMFDCYLNEPAKTAEAITEDGWFLTSDAAYIDENDHLIVIGRYDYVIKHKDLILYPSTIEKPIQMVPGVETVVVIPVPNKANHHNICACVVRKEGSDVTAAQIKKSVADKNLVAPHHVVFLKEVKINERGKMQKNEIIEYAVQQIEAAKAE